MVRKDWEDISRGTPVKKQGLVYLIGSKLSELRSQGSRVRWPLPPGLPALSSHLVSSMARDLRPSHTSFLLTSCATCSPLRHSLGAGESCPWLCLPHLSPQSLPSLQHSGSLRHLLGSAGSHARGPRSGVLSQPDWAPVVCTSETRSACTINIHSPTSVLLGVLSVWPKESVTATQSWRRPVLPHHSSVPLTTPVKGQIQ